MGKHNLGYLHVVFTFINHSYTATETSKNDCYLLHYIT